MKRALMFVLMISLTALADDAKDHSSPATEALKVATALDHLTVIEFGEPVMMAAVGSPSFQIERHEDKVFIKPLKTGASTDLFVWTASRRFTFELEPPGDVAMMNSLIDRRIPAPAPKPAPDSQDQLNATADMMLSRAFLGAERISSGGIRDRKDSVNVHIESVFQSKTTLYVLYTVRNMSSRPYRVLPPTVIAALAPRPGVSLVSLSRFQIDPPTLAKLGRLKERSLSVARNDLAKQDLAPGDVTQGVVAIREQLESPTLIGLNFGSDGTRRVQAVMVF